MEARHPDSPLIPPEVESNWGADVVDEIAESERRIRREQARQAKLIAALHDMRLEAGRRFRLFDSGDTAKSLIGEIAMARQISASAAANQFSVAVRLQNLPRIHALFADGVVSERVVRAVTAEIVGLVAKDRRTLDEQLAPEVAHMTAKRAGAEARKLVIALDAHAAQDAASTARRDRHVSFHPLPHAMAAIRMNLPAVEAAAVFKALDNLAQGLKYEGDKRTASQIMADTAVERITGQASAGNVAVEVGLLMTPESLLGESEVPALLEGYGAVPPAIARHLAAGSQAWLRRLFTDPISGDLIARDPKRRRFDGPLGAFVRDRDLRCTRPWCDCKIRDADHIEAFNGSNTTADNAQGLCKRSHTTKHLPRWRVEATKSGTIWTTPTGHRYESRRPKFAGYGTKMRIPKILDTESVPERQIRDAIGQHRIHRRQ